MNALKAAMSLHRCQNAAVSKTAHGWLTGLLHASVPCPRVLALSLGMLVFFSAGRCQGWYHHLPAPDLSDILPLCCPHVQKKAGSAFDKDPHEWFSSLGIKSEAEFQARKADLQAEARRRLAGLEEAKAKLRELDPDADSDSDISEFDDDMNSLHSISSTARKWATEANFKGPALLWIKGLSPVAVVRVRAHQ